MNETSPAFVSKLFNSLPPSERRVLELFLTCLVVLASSPIEGAESPPSVIGPGMVLKDVIIPISQSIEADSIVLSAREAKTLDPPNILRLERAKSVFSDWSDGYSSIHVKNAVFDSLKKEIISLNETDLSLHIGKLPNTDRKDSGKGVVRYSKRNQPKSLNSRLHTIIGDGVDASGSLFVEVKAFPSSLLRLNEVTAFDQSNEFWTINKPVDHIFPEFPTRLKLVQEMCSSLANFFKCWPLADGFQTNAMGCFSNNGGRLAPLEKGIMINGPAGILSKAIVMSASDGIFFRLNHLEDHEVMETHVLANNGVKAVVSDGKGDVAIECQSFKHIVETRASQFEGGPVVMRRNHVTLVAEESWQFVRVFDYQRVVLSPGKWQVVGTLNPDEASGLR